jgi:hypothetical protein
MKAKCCFMALGVGLSTPAFAECPYGMQTPSSASRSDGTAKSEDPHPLRFTAH